MAKEKIIGIDLGTSNSAAAVLEAGKPTIIPSAEGNTVYGKAFPSVVAMTKEGALLVGEPARRQAISNPEQTITAIKRKMGTDYKVKLSGKDYTPEQISAFILQKIKKDAESFLGCEVKKAVITVPAYFDDNQRQATKSAGAIAGLDVVRIINEPTAASLAFGLDKTGKEIKSLVFDLGGGTLDVTIMELSHGVFEVKSTSGDTQLGGTDMDKALLDYVVSEFKKQENVDLTKDKMATQRLKEAVEKAKIELSTVISTDLNLPYITADSSGPKHLTMTLSRAKLEELVEPIVKKCEKPLRQALADAQLEPKDIDKIILVGGPTRMPIIQKFVEKQVGKQVERGIDPMECVAAGAAIQGAVLAGEIKDILLLDVTPLSLGIETLGGVFTKLIERNTTIPVKKSQIFSTAADSQTAVTIHILQGERQMASFNKSLGRFDLVGIPPAPRGIPQIEVSFDIDANGIVNVSAKDKATGKEQSIKIVASQKLDENEIEKMRKEAEELADEDVKKKKEIETINEADSVIYTSTKLLDDVKGKVDETKLKPVREKIEELKKLMEPPEKDANAIRAKLDELNKLLQEIGSEMYKQAGAQQNESQPNETDNENKNKKKGNIFDADFKMDDDKK